MDLPIKVTTFQKAKGFLRNKAKLIKLQVEMNDPNNINSDKAMAEFVQMYTIDPADKDAAMELILDFSQEELNEAIALISGVQEIPKASGGMSETSTSQEPEPLPSG